MTVDQEGKVSLRGSDQVADPDRRQAVEPDRFRHAARARQRFRREHRGDRDHQQPVGAVRRGRHGRHHQHHLQAGTAARPVGRCRHRPRHRAVHETARRSPTDLGSFSHNEKIIPSVNLNYRTQNVRTFIQGEVLFQDDLPNNEFTTRFYDDGRVIESQVPGEPRAVPLHRPARRRLDGRIRHNDTVASPASTTSRSTWTWRRCRSSCSQPASASASGSGARKRIPGFTNVNFNLKHQFAHAGARARREPPVHARAGGRSVLPERGVAGARRHRHDAPDRRGEHAAAEHRLHAPAAEPAASSSAPSCSGAGFRSPTPSSAGSRASSTKGSATSPTGTRTSMPRTPTWSASLPGTRWRLASARRRRRSRTRFRTRTSTTRGATPTTTSSSSRT